MQEIGGGTREQEADTREALGDVATNAGQYVEALAHYAAALEALTPPPSHGPVAGGRSGAVGRPPLGAAPGRTPAMGGLARPPAVAADPERLATLHRKAALAHERRGEYPAALDRLGQAETLLVAAAGAELARVCIAMAGVLYRQGQPAEALARVEQGLALAEELGDCEGVAHARLLRGVLQGTLGDTDAAIADCQRSVEASEQSGDLLLTAKAHNNLALQYYYKAAWDRAAEHYRLSLDIRERIGDVNGMATVANNLGELYLIQGQLDAAARCFARCLDTWQRTGYRLGVALSRRNLAQVCLRRAEWGAAAAHLEAARGLLEALGARDWLMAEVCRDLAEAQIGLGHHDRARAWAEQALEITRSQGIRLVEANAHRTLGRLARVEGRWPEAETALQASLRLAEAQGQRYEAGQAFFELALLARARRSRRRGG